MINDNSPICHEGVEWPKMTQLFVFLCFSTSESSLGILKFLFHSIVCSSHSVFCLSAIKLSFQTSSNNFNPRNFYLLILVMSKWWRLGTIIWRWLHQTKAAINILQITNNNSRKVIQKDCWMVLARTTVSSTVQFRWVVFRWFCLLLLSCFHFLRTFHSWKVSLCHALET